VGRRNRIRFAPARASVPRMFGLGPWEIGLVVVALLLVLGPTRLPELARSMAKGVKEFRRAARETEDAPQVGASTPHDQPAPHDS